MPFTFSIATGIGLGFITYVLAKVLAGRARELNSALVAVALAFTLRFALTLVEPISLIKRLEQQA